MKKLTLNLDLISVQSFATEQSAAPSWGTVRGHDGEELAPSYLRPSQCITSCTRDDER